MLLKRIKHNEAKLRRGEWAQRGDRGEFLFGKTVGLVGLGRVGSHVARRLVNWDVRLLAADPYVSAERAAVARRHAWWTCRPCWPSATSCRCTPR